MIPDSVGFRVVESDVLYAVIFAHEARTAGFYPHQHLCTDLPLDGPLADPASPFKVRDEAVPVTDASGLAHAQDIMRDIVRELQMMASNPPPEMSSDSVVSIPWCDARRPSTFLESCLRSGEYRRRLIAGLASELLSGYSGSPSQELPVRSSGRVFLGPRDRFIYWPEAVNLLSRDLPVHYECGTVLPLSGHSVGAAGDLKAAYRRLPLHPSDAVYFGIWIGGVLLVVRMLPFGLKQAPHAFCTRLGRSIRAFRATFRGYVIVVYMDDIGSATPSVVASLRLWLHLLRSLIRDGWIFSIRKLYLYPCSVLPFTGVGLDLLSRSTFVLRSSAAKATGDIRDVSSILRETLPDSRDRLYAALVHLRGRLSYIASTVPWMRPFTRAIDRAIGHLSCTVRGNPCFNASRPSRWGPGRLREAGTMITGDLNAWYEILPTLHEYRSPVIPPLPSLIVCTDASETGWGALVTRPHLPSIALAGAFSPSERLLKGSGPRELLALLHACRAAASRGLVFRSVHATTDANIVAQSLPRWSMRSADFVTVAKELSVLARTGVSFRLTHVRRDDGQQPLVDALSGAIPSVDWRLSPVLASALADHISDIWDLDLYASEASALAPAYASFAPPQSARSALVAEAGASRVWASDVGYQGPALSVPLAGRGVLAYPPSSQIPGLAARLADLSPEAWPRFVVLVWVQGRSSQQGNWWDHALVRLLSTFGTGVPYRCSSDVQLVIPPDGNPDRCDRLLTVFCAILRPPARLPSSGAPVLSSSLPPAPSTLRLEPEPASIPRWYVPSHDRPLVTFEPDTAMSLLLRAGDIEENPGPHKAVSLDLYLDSVHTATERRPRSSERSVFRESDLAVFPSEQSPADVDSLTLYERCSHTLAILTTGVDHMSPSMIPRDIHPDVRHVYVSVLREIISCHRVRGAAPSLRRFIEYVVDSAVGKCPPTEQNLAVVAAGYARRRLSGPPLPGWRSVEPATVAGELSTLAGALRASGWSVPPYLGDLPARLLACRGAFEKREHSNKFPIHMHDLRRARPPASSDPEAYGHWCALVVQASFCLRPGIVSLLRTSHLCPWADGWVLRWREVTKTKRGDRRLGRRAIIKAPQFSAARHPLLSEALSFAFRRLPSGASDELLFPKSSTSVLTSSVKKTIAILGIVVPSEFAVGSHGVRVGCDTELSELGCPEDVLDVFGWWKRSHRRMSTYYSGLNVRKLFYASSYLGSLSFQHWSPGAYCSSPVNPASPRPDWSLFCDHEPQQDREHHTDHGGLSALPSLSDAREFRASRRNPASHDPGSSITSDTSEGSPYREPSSDDGGTSSSGDEPRHLTMHSRPRAEVRKVPRILGPPLRPLTPVGPVGSVVHYLWWYEGTEVPTVCFGTLLRMSSRSVTVLDEETDTAYTIERWTVVDPDGSACCPAAAYISSVPRSGPYLLLPSDAHISACTHCTTAMARFA